MTMLGNQSVRLPFEEPDGYDAEIYAPELLRAAESLVSPLGWEREEVPQRARRCDTGCVRIEINFDGK